MVSSWNTLDPLEALRPDERLEFDVSCTFGLEGVGKLERCDFGNEI